MRLLNVATRKLESFDNEYNIPPYAILSHTWGDEEVLFNHIMGSDDAKREGEKHKGHAKILGACKQAIEDGWEYIWIDTCCINKESSAELSEAINSMYKWYQEAEVCYVYLEDVRSNAEDIQMDENEGDSTVKTVPFERSRWFSRGWTLQELLAPQYIVFYSRDWVDIGTKASLQNVISDTTHIRVEMLMRYDPKETSVAERMSWAACRMTTRKEDMAYCLMGLFGVNMPLLYGEGNKAFRRLQEEIMKVSDDHSLFAWKGFYNDYTIPDDVDRFPVNRKARGMLADSPWGFRDGADIISSDGAYSPYSMTNQGLQIQLPLQPVDLERDLLDFDSDYTKNIFKAMLKCTIRNKQPTRWIVIYLKMTRKGYYERVFAHWLDTTEIDPNENELTSLLVPQVDTSTTNEAPRSQEVKMRTLPTESGFTTNGHSLVEGYEDPSYKYVQTTHESIKATLFDGPEGEHFAVVIGSKDRLFWLDVVDVNKELSHLQKRGSWYDIEQVYKEGGCRYNKVLQHLDRLSVRVSDWSVVVSAKSNNRGGCHLRVTVDIQREPILSNGWYTPSDPTFTSGFSGDLLTDYIYGYYAVHPDFKKECDGWIAIFNPKADRTLDVSLVHSITSPAISNDYSNFADFVLFSSDGKYLVVEYTGCPMRVYDTNTGEPCILFDGEDAFDKAMSVCFSPDGKFLAIGSHQEKIVVWDIEKGNIHKVLQVGDDQYLGGFLISLCFSLDSRLIVSGSIGTHGTIRIWDIADETPHSTFVIDEPSIESVAISHNGRLIAGGCSSESGTVYIWDITTTQLIKKFEGYDNVVFTPDGKRLVVGGDYGVGLLDVGEWVPSHIMGGMEGSNEAGRPGPDDSLRVSGMLAQGETIQQMTSRLFITSVAVSCDGQWAISGSVDGSVHFWNLEEGTAQFMLEGHVDSITSVDMSPVGNIFATSSRGSQKVRIWRYDTMKFKKGEMTRQTGKRGR